MPFVICYNKTASSTLFEFYITVLVTFTDFCHCWSAAYVVFSYLVRFVLTEPLHTFVERSDRQPREHD